MMKILIVDDDNFKRENITNLLTRVSIDCDISIEKALNPGLRRLFNDKYDITVPNNYFNYKIKEHNVFYVDKDIYELGLTEVKTPMENSLKVYNIERCICDIIRSKNRMDSEHIKYSIRAYLKSKDKDLVKLSNYAKKMGIKDEVMNYIEVFYEIRFNC